ncbi:MAG: ATP-binding protein [Bacteroidales bacterium]|nr:ATP-binding protein [Bacteroidales bacterium]
MERKVMAELVQWKDKKNRMPLIVNGARQVGKTYILKEFGASYFENTIYVHLENQVAVAAIFEGDLNPTRIIQYLEATYNQPIKVGKTLIIFDEIQSSERALMALKVFCEEAPQYHVVAAGSLLGVAVNREKYSFPVGKVDEIYMYPLDFEEFLWAMGKRFFAEETKSHFADSKPLENGIHQMLIELYRQYLITGGMPAVVRQFVETQSFIDIVDIQSRIVNEYLADMAKYATASTSVKIRACYNSIPTQLAKENTKFQYKVVQKGGSATLFGESIDWLESAGIVLKCQKTTQGLMPIAAYADLSDFKLYMADVGLLTMKSGISYPTILSTIEQDNNFLGALAENYVAQQFKANQIPLYYWKNDNTAEVDFVLQTDSGIIPVEVKKGKRNKAISMNLFSKKYNSPYSIRISQKHFGFDNNIKAVPLYATFCISK